jgi:hypothetical protein
MRYLVTAMILALFVTAARAADDDKAERNKKLADYLTGAKLTGHFTVAGKEMKELPAEEYTIVSAEKTDEGEYWLLRARIKYGGKDTTVPVPIEILWAGKTPVLTLDNITLPGLGTFSTRVVLNDDKYAGTWQHDKVGGHLFGTITRANGDKDGEKSPKEDDNPSK